MSGTVKATFWAQIEPRWSAYYTSDLRGITIRKVTQRKPKEYTLDVGTVLVKLTVELPRDAFVSPVFEGEITIEPGQFERITATVEAEPLGEQP
jgi:hypothetical protein